MAVQRFGRSDGTRISSQHEEEEHQQTVQWVEVEILHKHAASTRLHTHIAIVTLYLKYSLTLSLPLILRNARDSALGCVWREDQSAEQLYGNTR